MFTRRRKIGDRDWRPDFLGAQSAASEKPGAFFMPAFGRRSPMMDGAWEPQGSPAPKSGTPTRTVRHPRLASLVTDSETT